MGVRSWLQQRFLRATATRRRESLDLLSDAVPQVALPTRAGIDHEVSIRPWSVARLEGIVRESGLHPSVITLQAARQARHCLSAFWLAAPADQLEAMYSGPIGDLQRLQLNGPLVQQALASDEQRWRDQLSAELSSPEQKPRQLNLLLALMPYASPGQLSVREPLESLPNWLLGDYIAYCEPELESLLQEPVGLLEAATEPDEKETLEPLTDHRGDVAIAWFQEEDALTRMTDFINYYSRDATDPEVLAELSGLRCVVAQLWLDIEDTQVQSLYASPVGLVTRSLITSNFGCELVDEQDQRARAALTPPESPAGLIAMLLFYPLGAVDVADVSSLPDWLAQELDTLQ